MELPPLSPDNSDVRTRCDWWNARLVEWGVDASIVAGAEAEIRLNA